MILTSLRVGIERARRNWKMVCLLVVGSLIFAAPVATLVLTVVIPTSSGTQTAPRLLADKIDAVWLIDLVNEQFPGTSLVSLATQSGLIFVLMAILYLIANAFVAGGIIEVLSAPKGEGFSMRAFWSGAGVYFWRFVRLWLISLAGYGAVFIVYSIVLAVIESSEQMATTEGPVVIKKWAATFVLLPALALVNMTFDYARIITARNGSRKMFRETGKAIRFVAQRFLQAATLYLLLAIIAGLLFWLVVSIRSAIPQSSLFLVLIALLAGQVAMATRMCSKIAFYAAEMDLYDRVVPHIELIPTVRPIVPEFAVAQESPQSGSEIGPTPRVEQS
ncbi:MAG: hypothetical protein ABI882_02810 [Acidobacteriota bacterium]